MKWIGVAIFLLVAGCATSGPPTNSQLIWLGEHPAIPVAYRDSILNHQIMRGMSKSMVIEAWGKPCGYCRHGITHHKWGDTWVFNPFGNPLVTLSGPRQGARVYFGPDGKVSGWQ